MAQVCDSTREDVHESLHEGLSQQILVASAKGSFTNIATFIQRLERGPYLLGLQHVSIKNIGQGGDTEGNPFRGVEAVFSIEVMTRS